MSSIPQFVEGAASLFVGKPVGSKLAHRTGWGAKYTAIQQRHDLPILMWRYRAESVFIIWFMHVRRIRQGWENNRPMSLTADVLFSHPDMAQIFKRLAQSFMQIQHEHPRVSHIFGTQQRWLMAHMAMAIYFRTMTDGEAPGVTSTQFIEEVARTAIASKTTAYAFLHEMLKYGYAEKMSAVDKRFRYFRLSPISIERADAWLMVHLQALDQFDGGLRLARYREVPNGLVQTQPYIAKSLTKSPVMLRPVGTFSLFAWLNQGGLLMDALIAGLEEAPSDPQRIGTAITSQQEIASRLGLSRTHLARKLREAEEIGSVGWVGMRGRSTLWISPDFRGEYHAYQAAKLAIIDACFDMAGF